MKLVEFLGRKTHFEARGRRWTILALSLAAVGMVAAAVVAMSRPARGSSAAPGWMREDLPGWFLGLGAAGPALLLATRSGRLRRAGLLCPKCGKTIAGLRGEIVAETLCCPECHERIVEDGRRPDVNWSWLQPLSVPIWRRPRWIASAPRPDLRFRLGLYQRRARSLLLFALVGLAAIALLTATAGAWVPALFRMPSRFPGGFAEVAGWSAVPRPVRAVGLTLGLLAAPWIVGPWLLMRRHDRLLRRLRLRCPRCSVPLPPRAGLAVGLGCCGSCGAPVEQERDGGTR